MTSSAFRAWTCPSRGTKASLDIPRRLGTLGGALPDLAVATVRVRLAPSSRTPTTIDRAHARAREAGVAVQGTPPPRGDPDGGVWSRGAARTRVSA